MKQLLKTHLKPILAKVGLYSNVHRSFFYVISLRTYMCNLFDKMFCKTAPILLYHRVDRIGSDPVMLTVTPECFEEHMLFMKNNFKLIPLFELSKRITDGTLVGNEAAITFDDGYRDNILNALLILEKYKIPATIFVMTARIGEKGISERDLKYAEEDRATFLSRDELKSLASNPLIELGAHTVSHPRLVDLGYEEQKREMLLSKKTLESITGKTVRLFAYPFGGEYDINTESIKATDEIGFDFAFMNTLRLAKGSNSRFKIPRINIRESSVEELRRKLLR